MTARTLSLIQVNIGSCGVKTQDGDDEVSKLVVVFRAMMVGGFLCHLWEAKTLFRT